MPRAERSPEPYFDLDRFVEDLVQYKKRQKLTLQKMGKLADLHWNTVKAVLTKRSWPTLLTATALANVADLNLDDYRKDPHGHNTGRMEQIIGRTTTSSTTWDRVQRVS